MSNSSMTKMTAWEVTPSSTPEISEGWESRARRDVSVSA